MTSHPSSRSEWAAAAHLRVRKSHNVHDANSSIPLIPHREARLKDLLILLPCLFLVLQACEPVRTRPLIVGHRGASAAAPENTLAAFRLGFEQGADLVEGDFRLTGDGHIVAMHDRTLARTTGDPRETGSLSLSEIRSLDAGNWGPWNGSDFRGERVPTLAEVLAIIPADGGILVEIKDSERIVPALVLELERSGLGPDRVTVIAFDRQVIGSLKQVAPEWKALWLTSFSKETGHWRPTADEIIDVARSIDADGVDIRAEPEVIDESFVRQLRSAGLEVHVWTVNDPDLAMTMQSTGIDSITSDRPSIILKALD